MSENRERTLHVMQLILSLNIGGAEKLVFDMVHHIDKDRVFPVVCCLDRIGELGQKLRVDGYQVHVLQRRPGIDWSLIPQLHKLILQYQIDVIHAHQYTPYFYGLMASLYNAITREQPRPKIIVTEHGRTYYPERKIIKRMLFNPILSRFTDEIVTIAESTKATLVRCENYPAHRIKVVYNGIDLNHFTNKIHRDAKKRSLGLSSDVVVIGSIGRLDPIKNHAMLLRAFQQVHNQTSKVCLLIVGDGPERQNLTNLASVLEISEYVRFLGFRQDVSELLQVVDIFALSSFREGMSVSILEAMGTGLPVVATRVGGNPEIIHDQETGYLVPNDNDQVMADMLIKLVKEPELREKLGQAGQQRVEAMFSLEKMVNTYTNLYYDITGKEQKL